jgi:hypothetical protein
MDPCDFYYAIGSFQVIIYILPLITCWLVRKNLVKSDYYFAIFIFLQFALGVWSYLSFQKGQSNLFIFNYVTLLEILFGLLWFPKILSKIRWQKWSRYIGISLMLYWFSYPVVFQKYNVIYDVVNMLNCLFLAFFAGLGLFDILTNENKLEDKSTSNYYLLIGLFVSHSISGFFKLFETTIINLDPFLACTLESIDCLLVISGIFLFTWAFYKKANKFH